MEQTIFDMMYPKFKIDKPIKLIEMFGGYGSQFLSLKYINADVEHHKLIEWAAKSIQAYNDIHIQDYTDYSKDLTNDEVLDKLFSLGVSLNYNEPATREQLKRQNYRKIYNNIIATNNLVNIQQVKGKDLEITDKDKYIYVCSYSFPCQDLSNAGKKAGFNDTSTRSGMLWEVERILDECNELGQLPQVLLMENVIQIHSPGDNVKNFFKWQSKLESLGYKNYMQDLIATDYGIPQTRNRTFMVSILGDYSYTFPKPIPLKLKLKDMLEDNVDEKYYLSDKQIKDIQSWNAYEKPLENMEKTDKNNISPTLTTRSGAYAAGMILVKNATKQGYLKATDGDGIDISSRMEYHRGNVQKDKIQTITTSGGNDRGVVVNMKTQLCNNLIQQGKVKENDVIRHSYTTSRMNGEMKDLKQNNISPTLDTRCDCLGVVNNMRIRKLTPRECFRLMGVKDGDFEKCAKNQSDSSLYHLAGDSICTSCLMAIFGKLLDINWEEKLNKLLESKGE